MCTYTCLAQLGREASGTNKRRLMLLFYSADELPGRRMEEVPHPFVTETMMLFSKENEAAKAKIHFIHMNHTNPLLWDKSTRYKVEQSGFKIAVQGMKL